MATAKAERLLNLVIALLNTRQFRTALWIRDKVAGYADAPTTEAFNRMFERDKQELREMGIPLQTNDDDGYRIPQVEFSLPELSFTPTETAALGLAARLWSTTTLAGAGAGALRKITDAAPGATEPPEVTAVTLLQPRVRTGDPAFQPLYDAIRERRSVRFGYRKESSRPDEQRHLQPWGLVSFHGRWYLVGFDLDRGDRRTFRLSRVVGDVTPVGPSGSVSVPGDVNLLDVVRSSIEPVAQQNATLRIRPGRGAGLRRRAVAVRPWDDDPEWDLVEVPISGLWDTARRIAGLGADVLVQEPPELADAVLRLLTGAAESSGVRVPVSPSGALR